MEVSIPHERILYVITKANWGGAQRYVFDMAVASKRAGHEVTVAYGSPGRLAERLEEAGIPTLPLSSLTRDVRAGDDSATFVELVRAIRRIKPTVVHANSSKAGALAALAARISRVPRIVFTAHGWAFNEDRPKSQKAIIALLHYVTVLLSDVTICVSDAAKKDAAWMPFVQKRMVTIHNGVDPVTLLDRETARKNLVPHGPDSLWLGTIAELHPTKQLAVAIDAFARIADEFPTAIFVIMGDGQERLNLETLITERHMEGRVVLCGHVDQAPNHLLALDVFVLPSRSEGLAYVILEAGAAGLPVVASRVGGIPEIIASSEYGLLATSGDVSSFADSFSSLFGDADLRATLGTALKTRVSSEFSMQKMISRTLAQYALD